MRTALVLLPAFALSLAACGKSAEEAALENAAEQSTPEAAAVLENAAEEGANVQEAMQAAGNAQAGSHPAPISQGAKPHAPGDPVPPPKVPTGTGTGNASAGGNSH
jgi:hypothetical protein